MRRSQSAATEELRLLDDFERSALTMTRSGAVQHRANCVNGLPVATDDSSDVGLAQLHLKDRHFAARNFRQYHVVREFDQLPNDELEELFHERENSKHESAFAQCYGATGKHEIFNLSRRSP